MIDKDRIFQLFGNNNDAEGVRELVNANEDYLNSPTAKLGMFTKLIYNHEVFHLKLKKFFEREKAPYNAEQTKEASSFTVFNRAWSYINVIDLSKKDHIDAIWDFNSKPLIATLNKALEYFESIEEYEKCAKLLEIKKLKETLENSLDI